MSIDLAREGIYRFMAAAMRDPRDRGADLAREPNNQRLAIEAVEFLRLEADDRAIPRGFGELPIELLTLRPAVTLLREPFDDCCAEYDRVFGLVTSAECPPYETEYHAATEPFFRSQQLADVSGFYRAFGLDPSGDTHDRPDYLPLELEFMAFLLMKKRLAEDADNSEHMAICAAAAAAFFRDHVAWWVPSFATGLRRRAGSGLYAALAQALAAFLPTERQRLGVDMPTIPVAPKVIERPEEQVGCSACPASA